MVWAGLVYQHVHAVLVAEFGVYVADLHGKGLKRQYGARTYIASPLLIAS